MGSIPDRSRCQTALPRRGAAPPAPPRSTAAAGTSTPHSAAPLRGGAGLGWGGPTGEGAASTEEGPRAGTWAEESQCGIREGAGARVGAGASCGSARVSEGHGRAAAPQVPPAGRAKGRGAEHQPRPRVRGGRARHRPGHRQCCGLVRGETASLQKHRSQGPSLSLSQVALDGSGKSQGGSPVLQHFLLEPQKAS